MPESYDAIVLGVGGFGSSCLTHLARRGLSVLGVDQLFPGHSRGSSHGETRIIRQAYFEHPDYVPLLLRAYDLWNELQSTIGRDLLTICGLAIAGPGEGEAVSGTRLAAQQHNLELHDLSHDEAQQRMPGFSIPEHFDVVYESTGGVLKVEDCIRAHVDEAVRLGAQLRIGEEVIRWSSDGRTITIQTNRTTIEAATLVITAGAWSSQLLSTVPDVPKIQVLRKVLQWHRVRSQDYSIGKGGLGFLFEMPEGAFYGFPSFDGTTLKIAEHTGGEPVADPGQLDRSLRPEDVARLAEFISRVMPQLEPQPLRHSVCMYSMSPDGHFIVDRHPMFSNVVFGAGFSGHGFKFAPVVGEALADLAMNGQTDLPVDFLGLSRFH